MSMEDRGHIARAAKLCLSCHNPDYRWKRQDRDHKCRAVLMDGKKSHHTCTALKCKTHLWVCVAHKDQNKLALEKFKKEMSSKHSLRFGFSSSLPFLDCNKTNLNRNYDIKIDIDEAVIKLKSQLELHRDDFKL